MVFLNKVISCNRKHLCQVGRRTQRTTLLPFSTSTASPVRSPRKQKREKKPNFSEVDNVALLEEIGMENKLLMSHFQNGVTLKKKELMWRNIADKVNAVGCNGRTVAQVKKRWKDMKQAVLGVIHNCHHFHERTQRTLGGRGSRATVRFFKCRFLNVVM